LENYNVVENSVRSLPVDIKYQKGQSRDNNIIVLSNSKYKRRWINLIFLQDRHNSNAVP